MNDHNPPPLPQQNLHPFVSYSDIVIYYVKNIICIYTCKDKELLVGWGVVDNNCMQVEGNSPIVLGVLPTWMAACSVYFVHKYK